MNASVTQDSTGVGRQVSYECQAILTSGKAESTSKLYDHNTQCKVRRLEIGLSLLHLEDEEMKAEVRDVDVLVGPSTNHSSRTLQREHTITSSILKGDPPRIVGKR